eukprot:scaffold300_cov173-Ochromonas_danica.AAC.2
MTSDNQIVSQSRFKRVWDQSIAYYGPKAGGAWLGLACGTVLLEPILLAEGKGYSPKTIIAVNIRDAVYSQEMVKDEEMLSLGRAPIPLSQLFPQSSKITLKLLPIQSIKYRLQESSPLEAVLISRSTLQGRSIPLVLAHQPLRLFGYYLDRDFAPAILSEGLIRHFEAVDQSQLPWYQHIYMFLGKLFHSSNSWALIKQGQIILHSYDDERKPGTGSHSRSFYQEGVTFAMELLTSLSTILRERRHPPTSSAEAISLHHFHLGWQFNNTAMIKSISQHTIHNVGGYLEEQQERLVKIFCPLLLDSKLTCQSVYGDGSAVDENKEGAVDNLLEWQKVLLKLAFAGYSQESMEMNSFPSQTGSAGRDNTERNYILQYNLHSLDGRPLLLNLVMLQLIRLQHLYFANSLPVSFLPIVEKSKTQPLPEVLDSRQLSRIPSSTASDDLISSIFALDFLFQGLEQVGRAVRNVVSGLMDIASLYLTISIPTTVNGRLPSTNLEVFVDPESSDLSTSVLPSVIFPINRSTTITQYLLQGLYLLGVDLQYDWTTLEAQQLLPSTSLLPVIMPAHHDVTRATDQDEKMNKKVKMILTIAKDPTWLQYRVRSLSQQFPGHPICGVLTSPGKQSASALEEVNGQLPKQVVLVSVDEVMEQAWKHLERSL